MTKTKDIVTAVNKLMVGAFPEAKAHINRCAEGFKRPAYLISRPKVRRTDANFALLRVSVSFTVTYFAPVDEKTATSDAEALEDAQDAILGLFDCGYLAVGDRKLTVTLSAGDPGADSVPVTVSLDYFEDRPMPADTTPVMKTVKTNVNLKKE